MSSHVDPDDLALLALGERNDNADEQHLTSCPTCSAELDQMRAVIGSARAVSAEDKVVTPPERVWDAVAAELGLTSAPGSTVTTLASRRRRLPVIVLTMAASLIGLVLGVALTLSRVESGRPDPALPVLAETELTVLSGDSPGGDAEVLRDGTGRLLELDVPTLADVKLTAGAYYQVWLLGTDGTSMVAVGLIDPAQGTQVRLPLPAGLDVARYPIVDVSLESNDGNPAHSGDSVIRGTLPF